MTDSIPLQGPEAIDTGALVAALPGRAVELLAVYTRLEFTLKEVGLCRTGQNRAAEADWDRFANKRLGKDFLAHVIDSGAAPTLLGKPPSVQIVENDVLHWRPSKPPVSVQDLVGAVRRVRNNLAHGGKSGTPDGERDVRLVEEALAVLLMAVAWDDVVQTVFSGRY